MDSDEYPSRSPIQLPPKRSVSLLLSIFIKFLSEFSECGKTKGVEANNITDIYKPLCSQINM